MIQLLTANCKTFVMFQYHYDLSAARSVSNGSYNPMVRI